MSGLVLRTMSKEKLIIVNQTEDPDSAGGLKRESFAILNANDDTPSANIRLALRLRLKPKKQVVKSFELFDGTQWHELVPDMQDESVSADAERFWKPKDPNFYWQGYLFPGDWVQRPFQGTFTRLQFSPAGATSQRIDWLVNYDPNTFGAQNIIGHSDIKAHPSGRSARRGAAKRSK